MRSAGATSTRQATGLRLGATRLSQAIFEHKLDQIDSMALIVQKYGGTSVGSIERIGAVADRVKRCGTKGHQVVVVVSAMSGETDRLIGLAKQIQDRPVPRELDVLLSTGEQVTIALLSMALDATAARRAPIPAPRFTSSPTAPTTRRASATSTPPGCAPIWRPDGWWWLQASRGSTPTAISPPWGAAGRIPRPLPSRPPSRPTSARSTPTWTGSTPPIRAW